MFHYQPVWQKCKTFKEWDKAVSEFDADGLAKQLKGYGAGYLVITSRHGGDRVALLCVMGTGWPCFV